MEGLYTIDLVCHGKPPQKLFSHWIKTLEGKLRGEIIEYKFRDKRCCNWNDRRTHVHAYRLKNSHEGGVPANWNWYGRYFLGSASFRPSCYQCPFAKLPRVGDVTLADFWRAEQRDERFKRFEQDGLSLVTVQSEKGQEMIDGAGEALDVEACSAEFALSCNGGLNHCSRMVVYRKFLFKFVYLPELIRAFFDKLLFGSGKLVRKFISRGC